VYKIGYFYYQCTTTIAIISTVTGKYFYACLRVWLALFYKIQTFKQITKKWNFPTSVTNYLHRWRAISVFFKYEYIFRLTEVHMHDFICM